MWRPRAPHRKFRVAIRRDVERARSHAPEARLDVTLVGPADPESFRRAIRENTKAIFAETIGNPKIDVLDVEAVAAVAHQATDYSADVVVHSATKFIGGHGTSIGGSIVDSGKLDWTAAGKFPSLMEPDPPYHRTRFAERFSNEANIIKARVRLRNESNRGLVVLSGSAKNLPLR